jgi:hypothetical protein
MPNAVTVDEDVTESAQEAPEALPNDIKPVSINRFGLAGEHRNEWRCNAKVGTTPDQALDAAFYEHIARHLNRGDIVEIMPDDLAWELNVRVLDHGHNWAVVSERWRVEHQKPEASPGQLTSDYDIKWAGTTDKFAVKYKGELLKKGFATEDLARRFAANHAQALRR